MPVKVEKKKKIVKKLKKVTKPKKIVKPKKGGTFRGFYEPGYTGTSRFL